MKTITNVLFLFLFLGLSEANAQYIIAGIYSVNDYYHDLSPDSILHAPDHVYNTTTDSLLIDANNDSIFDFMITCEQYDALQWEHYVYRKITPLNNNQIAIGYFDSCFAANHTPLYFLNTYPMAKAFGMNDSINANNTWIDSMAYLAYYHWDCCYPNNWGYNCSNSTFSTNAHYLGIKVRTSVDTLFGWIKVSGITNSNDSLVVEAFACNKIATAINNYQLPFPIVVYPNPTKDKVYIKIESQSKINYSLTVYDLLGKILYQDNISSKIYEIDLKAFQKGLYFLNLKKGNENIISKIIVN